MERTKTQSSSSSSHPSHPAFGASSLADSRPSREQKPFLSRSTTNNETGQDTSSSSSSLSTMNEVAGSALPVLLLPKFEHRPGPSHHLQHEHEPGTRIVLKNESSCSTNSLTSSLRDTTVQQRLSAGSSLGTIIRHGGKGKEQGEPLLKLALGVQADDGSPTTTAKQGKSKPHQQQKKKQKQQQHGQSLSAIEKATHGTGDASVTIPFHSDAVNKVPSSSFLERKASQETMNKASPWSTPPRTPTASAGSKVVPLRSTPVNRRNLMERQYSEITMSDWSDSAHSMGSDQHHRRRNRQRHHHNSPAGTPGPPSKATAAARGVMRRQRSRRWKSIQQRSFRDLASFESLDECWYDDYHDDDGDDDNEDRYVDDDDEQQELLGLDASAFLDGLATSSQDELVMLADSSAERFLASSVLRATAPALEKGGLTTNPPAPSPSPISPRTLGGSRPAMMTSTSPLATEGTDAIRRRSLERLQLSLEPPLRSPSPRGVLEESQPSTEEENNQGEDSPQPATEPCSTEDMRAAYFKMSGSLPLNSVSTTREDWTGSQDIRISTHSGHSSFSSYFGGGVREQEETEAVRFDGPIKRPTRKLSPPRFRVDSTSEFKEKHPDETISPQEDSDIASLVLEIVDAGDFSNLDVPTNSDEPKNRTQSYMQSRMTSPSSPPHASVDPMSLRSRWDHNEVSVDKMNGLRCAGHMSHASFFADAVKHEDSPIRVPPRKPSPYPTLARNEGEEGPILSGLQEPNSIGKVSLRACHGALQIPLRKLSLHSTSCQDASTTSGGRRVEEEGQARETSDSTHSVTPPPPMFQPLPKQVGDTPATLRPCCSSPIGLERPKKPERKLSSVPRSFSSPVDTAPQEKLSTATQTSLLLQQQQHAKASPKSVMDVSSIRAQRAISLKGFVYPSPSAGIH